MKKNTASTILLNLKKQENEVKRNFSNTKKSHDAFSIHEVNKHVDTSSNQLNLKTQSKLNMHLNSNSNLNERKKYGNTRMHTMASPIAIHIPITVPDKFLALSPNPHSLDKKKSTDYLTELSRNVNDIKGFINFSYNKLNNNNVSDETTELFTDCILNTDQNTNFVPYDSQDDVLKTMMYN